MPDKGIGVMQGFTSVGRRRRGREMGRDGL
jgi:hypothetical protein